MLDKWNLDESYHYLVYDDVCKLCNSWVRFVIHRDKKDIFRFVALQSELGQQLRANAQVKEGIETVLLLSENKLYSLSDVSFRCVRLIGGAWRLFSIFKIIPSFIRNAVYLLIKRNRYRWFGKYEACPIIPTEWQHKFMD